MVNKKHGWTTWLSLGGVAISHICLCYASVSISDSELIKSSTEIGV